MNRRDFLAGLAIVPFQPRPVSSYTAQAQRDPISINATGVRFTPPSGGRPWAIEASDITINGITLPRFGAGWVAANLASGVLSAAGGFLFSMFASAVGLGGPSLQELLRRQLEEIERIVRAVIRENEIRRSIARLDSIQQKMREYMNVPSSLDRLYDATSDSQNVYADLVSLGFPLYFETLSAGSIRLAVLQERVKRERAEARNYSEFVGTMVRYHENAVKQIDQETSLAAQTVVDKPVLGYPVHGLDKFSRDSPESRQLMIAEYNVRIRAMRGPFEELLPPTFDPVRAAISSTGPRPDAFVWGIARNTVLTWLTEPHDSIEAKYIDWATFRTKARNATVVVGSKIVEDFRASIPTA